MKRTFTNNLKIDLRLMHHFINVFGGKTQVKKLNYFDDVFPELEKNMYKAQAKEAENERNS